MSNIRWCGKKKCSECEETVTCEVDNSLACSADCEGFIDGTELRDAMHCFKHCDISKIRAVMEIEHGDDCELLDIFDREPNHVHCTYCSDLILPGEQYKTINVQSPSRKEYLCMDVRCEHAYMQQFIEVETLK